MLLQDIYSRRRGSIKPGLERISQALTVLQEHDLVPIKSPPLVLVAGTNGKGTVAGRIWQLLTANGYRAGLYTSPHISSFGERFQVGDDFPSDADINSYLELFKKVLPSSLEQELTFFELSTLIAPVHFYKKQCTVNIFEVGMGGRWDATNVFNPDVSIVTSIDLDHQDWLGSDLHEIAQEKLGIAREGKPLLWCEDPERTGIFEAAISLIKSNRKPLFHYMSGKSISDRYEEAAKKAVGFLFQDLNLSDSCILPSVVTQRGRFQRVKNPQFATATKLDLTDLVLDIAHNPAAVRNFCENIKSRFQKSSEKMSVLVTFFSDKNISEMVQYLEQTFKEVCFFSTDHDRCLSQKGWQEITSKHSWDANFEEALARVTTSQVAVCGSFSAIEEAFRSLDK